MNLGNAPEPVQVGTARWLGASLPWTQHPPPRFLGTNRPRLVGQPQGGWPVHAAPQTPEWAADRQHSGVGCGTQVWESALGLLAREDCVWETCHPPPEPETAQRSETLWEPPSCVYYLLYRRGSWSPESGEGLAGSPGHRPTLQSQLSLPETTPAPPRDRRPASSGPTGKISGESMSPPTPPPSRKQLRKVQKSRAQVRSRWSCQAPRHPRPRSHSCAAAVIASGSRRCLPRGSPDGLCKPEGKRAPLKTKKPVGPPGWLSQLNVRFWVSDLGILGSSRPPPPPDQPGLCARGGGGSACPSAPRARSLPKKNRMLENKEST